MASDDGDLKAQRDEVDKMIAAAGAAHEAAARSLLLDLATRQVEDLARALEGWSRILSEAGRALLEFAEAAHAPAIRQRRLYEEYFGIWHGEN